MRVEGHRRFLGLTRTLSLVFLPYMVGLMTGCVAIGAGKTPTYSGVGVSEDKDGRAILDQDDKKVTLDIYGLGGYGVVGLLGPLPIIPGLTVEKLENKLHLEFFVVPKTGGVKFSPWTIRVSHEGKVLTPAWVRLQENWSCPRHVGFDRARLVSRDEEVEIDKTACFDIQFDEKPTKAEFEIAGRDISSVVVKTSFRVRGDFLTMRP